LEGSSKITCEYGGVYPLKTFKNDHNDDNQLNIVITPKFSPMHNAKITSDYSSLYIGSVDNLTLKADYGHTEIDAVGGLNRRWQIMEDLTSQQCQCHHVGQNDYLNLSIGKINKKLVLNCDYGTLKINKIDQRVLR
jgi:hypothetical protein